MTADGTPTTTELPEEARSWLRRTLLFETMLETLRHGEAVIASDRIWTLEPPTRPRPQDQAAA